MKMIPWLIYFLLFGFISCAQSFFYIKNGSETEKSIRDELIKASQYVTKTPLASDYIIYSTAVVQQGTNVLNLKMTLQDSLTLKTVYTSEENFAFFPVNTHSDIFLKMVVSGFIERNVNRVILCAREEHLNAHNQFLKSRKDRT